MKLLISFTTVALFGAAFFVSDAKAENSKGTCNAIVATALGSAQDCSRMSCEPGIPQCMDVTNAFVEFVATQGCVEAFQNDELNGLPGNASASSNGSKATEPKNIQFVVCTALKDCGLCPSALALGICPTLCLD